MVLTLELALALVTALLAIWGTAWGIIRWVLGQMARRDKEIEALRRSLEAHKLYAAENYVTGAEVSRALGKVETAIENLTSRLDALLMTRPRSRTS